MTDHSNDVLPETIRWERRGVTLQDNHEIRQRLKRDGYWEHLTAQGSSILNVELSVSAGTLASPYGAKVSVEAFGETRSLHGYGATPEAAMEAVDRKWEELALQSCPWLKPAAAAPAPESEADDEMFYATDDCDEYTHTDAGDAIEEYLQKYEPEDWPAEIEIYTYRKVPVSAAFKRAQALAVLSDLADALEEHYGDDDFYFDMEALQEAEGALRVPYTAPAAAYADPVPSRPLGPPPSPRAVEADRARDAAFEAAKVFVEAVVAQYKVGRLEEVKGGRATFNTAQWVRKNCPYWEREPNVAAALARCDAEAPAERYCGCGDQLAAEEAKRCGRCDIEKGE